MRNFAGAPFGLGRQEAAPRVEARSLGRFRRRVERGEQIVGEYLPRDRVEYEVMHRDQQRRVLPRTSVDERGAEEHAAGQVDAGHQVGRVRVLGLAPHRGVEPAMVEHRQRREHGHGGEILLRLGALAGKAQAQCPVPSSDAR